jgi:hypothetical protein
VIANFSAEDFEKISLYGNWFLYVDDIFVGLDVRTTYVEYGSSSSV